MCRKLLRLGIFGLSLLLLACAQEAPIERVVIIGATSGSAQELIPQALERGYTVTALARRQWRRTRGLENPCLFPPHPPPEPKYAYFASVCPEDSCDCIRMKFVIVRYFLKLS